MTAAKLLGPRAFQTPERVADYFRFGADYVVDVSRDMGWETGDLDETAENAYWAMREGRTDVDDDVATLIGAVLVGDAEWWLPMGKWLPRGYAFLMRGLQHPLRRKLLRLGGRYTGTLEVGSRRDAVTEFYYAYPSVREGFGAPEFSVPDDVVVEGKKATAYVGGFENRVVLGDSIMHTEWYDFVARKVGVPVDTELVERTIDESKYYFTGVEDSLSDDVREFQRVMFSDSDWLRGVHDAYDLRSVLFRRAAKGIEETVTDDLTPS